MDPVRYRERKAAHRKWKRFWGVNLVVWFLLSWTVIGLVPLFISYYKIHKHSKALDKLTDEYEQSVEGDAPAA